MQGVITCRFPEAKLIFGRSLQTCEISRSGPSHGSLEKSAVGNQYDATPIVPVVVVEIARIDSSAVLPHSRRGFSAACYSNMTRTIYVALVVMRIWATLPCCSLFPSWHYRENIRST